MHSYSIGYRENKTLSQDTMPNVAVEGTATKMFETPHGELFVLLDEPAGE